jgi:hypothetical protein
MIVLTIDLCIYIYFGQAGFILLTNFTVNALKLLSFVDCCAVNKLQNVSLCSIA